jgi:superfamily II DNA or RNA helicase
LNPDETGAVQLSNELLARLAGWDAVKQARSLVAADRVSESDWQPPKLQGTVREGSATYRAGLVIRSASDADNLCTCRDARQRGLICAHSVAVGLHHLAKQSTPAAPVVAKPAEPLPIHKARILMRAPDGEPLELFIIVPPNLADAWNKGRIMLCLEGEWREGRKPLDQIPMDQPFSLTPQNAALLDKTEKLNQGDTPAIIVLNARQFAEILPLLAGRPHVTLGRTQPADFLVETARPEFKLHLAGGLAILQARLGCFYGPKSAQSIPDGLWLANPQMPTHFTSRDFAAEQAAMARLTRAGFAGPDGDGLYHMKGQDAVLNFFARHYPGLQKDWKVTLEERLETSTQKLERIEPHFQIISSGEQWFDLSVNYNTAGGERISTAEIQRLLRSGQNHTRLANGKFALLDTGAVEELEQVLIDAAPQQHAGGYRLQNAQAGFIGATLRQYSGWKVQAPANWGSGRVELKPPPLGALESVLRPYQKEGVAWLHFLRANGFGGILADEMGLGKTLQVLAHLNALKPHATPSLIVCPTSLVFNWEAEAAKFTPNLRVLALHGPDRHEQFPQIPQNDLIITSYALIRRDAEQYRGIEFDTVVLDEAQHIKNRQTQNAQAVKSVRARNRLVLTGTPLENSVLDLWSIFDFLMPSYLGTAQDFHERYEVPIERDRDNASQARLARRLRPFMLRRLKKEVAADLPERIEQVSYCELGEEQRALYQQVLEAGRKEMLDAEDQAKGRILVLTTLLRLRQICCDPRLLNLEKATAPATSGKTELFMELLEEALDGGHRILVFSQFTTMLGLLREELARQEIAFCYLDGATKDRAQVVAKFQTDADIPVFLISLKAGGVGLNLTGADTVVHFDPWWNPAMEAQATDRAHRIGQKKVVTSYKLIARGTVEEKILHLQNRKRALTQALLSDEEQWTQSLSWEEIRELLA